MTDLLPAIQADRDEAADYMQLIRDTRWSIEGILSGGCDNTSIVQAFARHRIKNTLLDVETVSLILWLAGRCRAGLYPCPLPTSRMDYRENGKKVIEALSALARQQ